MKNMENNSLNFDFNDGVLRVAIVGEINHHNAVFVRQEIDEKIQELNSKNLVLDLAEVSFMDSSGLGLIMGRYQRMQELGGTLTVANPSAEHKKLFKLAGLNKLVKIVKNDELK
jgi:stage II sporulation protein AA (anti-sigma F factor antagonist)